MTQTILLPLLCAFVCVGGWLAQCHLATNVPVSCRTGRLLVCLLAFFVGALFGTLANCIDEFVFTIVIVCVCAIFMPIWTCWCKDVDFRHIGRF